MSQDFGNYQLLKKLATGGMAEVWLARQHGIEGFERLAVVKRILAHLADDPEFLQMFLNEAKIAARFNHPNIAQIYDLGQANGTYFIAMEYIHGEDLGRLMRKAWSTGQWIALPLSIRIVAAACEGLHYAHHKSDDAGKPLKVVHRDISPQNILISFDGTVKVVDFGIAKAAGQVSVTRSGAIKGKFAYMSPEQAAGKVVDHRSDLFAMGLVLYELLTGVRPLKRDSELATLQAALECNIEPPSAVADVPSELDEVVMRALAKVADDRYRDAQAFQLALEEFLVGQRWIAGSVQIAELMSTLFADRLQEEQRLGQPNPQTREGSASGSPVPPQPAALPPADASASLPPATADMEWEAPPGQTQLHERDQERAFRSSSGRGLARLNRRESGSQPLTDPTTSVSRSRNGVPPPLPGAPTAEPPEAQAPSETSARRRLSNPNSTAVARSPSRPEVESPLLEPDRHPTPAEVHQPGREESEDPPPPPAGPPRTSSQGGGQPRRRSSSEQPKPKQDPDDFRQTGEHPVGAGAAPRRRRTGSVAKGERRRTSGFSISNSEVDRLVGVEDLKERSRRRLKAVLLSCVAVACLAMVLIFRGQIWNELTHTASDGQSIYLSVSTNPRTKVFVRHAREEGAKQQEAELGETPLQSVRGVHLRDTVILENLEMGLYYEEEIKLAEPNKVLKIEKTFAKGSLKVTVSPRGVTGLSFWRGSSEVGRYSPGLKIELYEGPHHLEVRGSALKKPFPLKVQVKPNATVERAVDLAGYLQ